VRRNTRYEFLFHTSRTTLWLGFLGSVYTTILGAGLFAAVLADIYVAAWLELSVRDAASIAALSQLLAILSGLVVRRTLVQAYDCRVGEAGIYFRTLLRDAAFVPWPSFAGFDVAGPVVRLFFQTPDGRRRSVWLEVPSGRATEALRLRTFLDGKLRARAALAFADASGPDASGPEAAEA
jgi:hypothetical protein